MYSNSSNSSNANAGSMEKESRPIDNFVLVPNDFATNPAVTPRAACLYLYLMTYTPADGELFEAAAKFAGMGKAATQGAIDDLIALGYMEKNKAGKGEKVSYTLLPEGKD